MKKEPFADKGGDGGNPPTPPPSFFKRGSAPPPSSRHMRRDYPPLLALKQPVLSKMDDLVPNLLLRRNFTRNATKPLAKEVPDRIKGRGDPPPPLPLFPERTGPPPPPLSPGGGTTPRCRSRGTPLVGTLVVSVNSRSTSSDTKKKNYIQLKEMRKIYSAFARLTASTLI